MGLFRPPISTHWKSLPAWQAWMLVLFGVVLELPVRWMVRPDIPYMVPGNPWFNLPLRIAIEAGFVLIPLLIFWGLRIPLPAIGVPRRPWSRWEWAAFGIVGAIELFIVILIAGHRWPTLYAAGVLGRALLWTLGEFFFGFNQEFVFRGILMTGLLRLTKPGWAIFLNTLLFLIGPLHGPGLLKLAEKNLFAAIGMLAGVVATGLFFSWLRYRSDNVLLCGVLHGLVNGFLNGAGFARRAYL
jgi:membrane protease YdiL (CAAX protease family)